MSDKTFEKKRRDTKTPTTLPKSIPISVPGPSGTSTPSTSKEIKKSKLIRSQSFNNQAFHAKYGNLDKCPRNTTPMVLCNDVTESICCFRREVVLCAYTPQPLSGYGHAPFAKWLWTSTCH
ncbi:serine/threonine-protein phosphatase 4 regulatory subunit 4-like [Ailuropoda melanoleuca]|uniref:serine/threonine-protein phosphatase 4 regulatory subunit 4-like n=1 Tax=Ailuropoda melanoleuca TaxID=9646 RepID=UPI001494D68A|nr:serine/threonine-protein phosphatase 4 regulatory subunit 4-like [Ailuropoda melanoleuca]